MVSRQRSRGVSTGHTKINENEIQIISLVNIDRQSQLMLKGRNIAFTHGVKNLGVIFARRRTSRIHIGTIKAKTFRTCITLLTNQK